MKKSLAALMVIAASSLFIAPASADCKDLFEGVKAVCGTEVYDALKALPKPDEAECAKFSADVEKVLAEHPDATEEELVEFFVELCLALAGFAK
jgi:hypothetical protein